MPVPPTPYSETVGAAILKRLAAGESLKRICRDDGVPGPRIVARWERTLPHFARRLRVAREAFQRLRLARRRPRAPTPELVGEICARVESGERLRIICRDTPHLPTHRFALAWARDHAEFARRYRAAMACAKGQRRYTPRRDADRVVEEICARLIRGENLRAICRDPAMPGVMTVWHWRKNIPWVDRRIREAMHELAPARLGPSLYSPALEREIRERLAAGESLNAICRSPHMPHIGTVCRWMNESPPFASRLAEAREEAEDDWHDHLRVAFNRAEGPGGDVAGLRAAMRRPKPPRAKKHRL